MVEALFALDKESLGRHAVGDVIVFVVRVDAETEGECEIFDGLLQEFSSELVFVRGGGPGFFVKRGRRVDHTLVLFLNILPFWGDWCLVEHICKLSDFVF